MYPQKVVEKPEEQKTSKALAVILFGLLWLPQAIWATNFTPSKQITFKQMPGLKNGLFGGPKWVPTLGFSLPL